MAFEGSSLVFLQFAMGLKPNTPLLRLAGPEDPRGTKWHLRGPYSYFYNL
ncbi:Hypothetical protein FKW44_005162 [Caligus rogercresseyi]|uniref:Uncharacterized protein n=1 Tax=Caligus rogercresseyi TaxID=217165 RepID=A0A7T8KBL4_CALRO|nr:Hypothetical protein FKW44_005162 [Caligus rogercresseyi]